MSTLSEHAERKVNAYLAAGNVVELTEEVAGPRADLEDAGAGRRAGECDDIQSIEAVLRPLRERRCRSLELGLQDRASLAILEGRWSVGVRSVPQSGGGDGRAASRRDHAAAEELIRIPR